MKTSRAAWLFSAMCLARLFAGCSNDEAASECKPKTFDFCPAGVGCAPVIQPDGACTRDFDCRVGQTCQANTCANAGAGATRDFGQVSMDFATGSEAYLLAVYSVPSGEAAADELLSYSLSLGGNPPGALRLAPVKRQGSPIANQAYWRDRIALESARRQAIDGLITDVYAGRRSLIGPTLKQAGCGGCSDTQMCWKGSCESAPVLAFTDGSTLTANVAGVVGSGAVKVTVLLDTTDAGAEAAALQAATLFATAADKALGLLGQTTGHAGGLDRDHDGHLAVVFTSKLATLGDVVGFFDYKDFLPANDGQATGNEADILWAGVPSTKTMATCAGACAGVTTQELSAGTLVHEYTHLVNFAVRVYAKGATPDKNEVLWLDEGMAHLMEDLTGLGASNIGAAAVALDEWPSAALAGPNDSVAQRGKAFTMLRHLVDQAGRAACANDAAASADVSTVHKQLLAESQRGFDHPILRSWGAEGIWQWLLATYATNNSKVSGTRDFDYLPVATASTSQKTGFDPFGAFIDARGVALTLTGPTLGDGSQDELTDFATPFETEVTASGTQLFIVTGLSAGTTLIKATGDASVDLQLRATRVW